MAVVVDQRLVVVTTRGMLVRIEELTRVEKEIGRLEIEFDTNIREDATRVPLTRDELRGLPDDWFGEFEEKNRVGDVLLVGMSKPEIVPAMEYADDLYNSISKGSAYYIPDLTSEVEALRGTRLDAELDVTGTDPAEIAALLRESGAMATRDGDTLRVTGDLGAVLARCLGDADALYANRSDEAQARYGFDGRHTLYKWWKTLKATDKARFESLVPDE